MSRRIMRTIALLAAALLIFSVTPAFSDDDNYTGSQEKDVEDDSGEHGGHLHFGDDSNKTISFDESNGTDIGHEISDYVHHRNELEKQKREEILAAQKDCIKQAKESGNMTAVGQCIKSLREQYKSYMSELNLNFTQFRQGLVPNHGHVQKPEQNKQMLYSIIEQASADSHQNSHNNTVHGHKSKGHH